MAIHNDFYDLTPYEKYIERHSLTSAMIATTLIFIGGIIALSYVMKNTTRYETYIDKFGKQATRTTSKYGGCVAGMALLSISTLISSSGLIGGVNETKSLADCEQQIHPRELSEQEIRELELPNLKIDRTRELLFGNHETRQANFGNIVRKARFMPEDLSFIPLAEKYHKLKLITENPNVSRRQKTAAEKAIGAICFQWVQTFKTL